jgi:hypothetical protein
MITAFECSQCGSTKFEEVENRKVRCAYCGSLFQIVTNAPVVVISKGANVVFGRNADVEIRGDLEVKNGANVEISGKVTVLEGNQKKDFRLKWIKESKGKNH